MKGKNLLYKGMRDFLPEDMIKREYVISIIKDVFESYGFEPVETPAIELWETLSGKYGDEEKLIYKFKDRGEREVGLRYDLTVPLSRLYATNREKILKPFKRYQIQPVWRADKPQKGRFREFYQCDVDIIGTTSLYADAELLKIIYVVLRKLGFKNFKIKINSRKIFPAIMEKLGEDEDKIYQFARAVDKLDKIGINGVKIELEKYGFSSEKIKILDDFKVVLNKKNDEVIEFFKNFFFGLNKGVKFVSEIEEFYNSALDFEIPESFIKIDPLLARGLNYYTGPIFETIVEKPKIGSITGGGRYDNLIGFFSGESVPATGTSLGLERIITVMNELSMFPFDRKTKVQLLFVVQDKKFIRDIIKNCENLRNRGLKCDIYFGKKDLRGQIKYALSRGIRYIAIIGEDELKENKISLKDLQTKEQRLLSIDEVYKRVILE